MGNGPARTLVALAALASFACSEDSPLPPGFEDAMKIDLVQAYLDDESDGDYDVPEGVGDGDIALSIREGRGYLLYVGDHGCYNPYAGYLKRNGDSYDLLVRFEAKSGAGPTACGGGLWAFRAVLDDASEDTRVTVYHQGHEQPTADRVGSARPGTDDADCASFFECGEDAGKCRLEGGSAMELGPPYAEDTHQCVEVDACGRSVCAWLREACLMTCGVPDCKVLESSPAQVWCD